ncbi:MAG TPA: hypothetical protein VGW38_26415 [Chloroflexota bacterium]|nr:hypothetical protein [Chloroflexota bacterium]
MQVSVSLSSRASVAIQRLAETGHLLWLALRLTWRSSPVLVGGIAVLLALEAAVYPVQLASMRFVVDRAALELGLVEPGSIHRGGAGAALLLQVPLAWWIIVAALLLIVRQLVSPIVSTLQSLAGDQLSGYVLDQVMRAANRWPGLARFEDPAFADDLQRARRQGARGGLEVLTYGGRAAVMLFTAAGLAVVLGSLHPLLPLLLVLATVPQMLWQWQYRHRTNSHLYGQTPETRRLEYSRDLLLQPEPAKDVRLGIVTLTGWRGWTTMA